MGAHEAAAASALASGCRRQQGSNRGRGLCKRTCRPSTSLLDDTAVSRLVVVCTRSEYPKQIIGRFRISLGAARAERQVERTLVVVVVDLRVLGPAAAAVAAAAAYGRSSPPDAAAVVVESHVERRMVMPVRVAMVWVGGGLPLMADGPTGLLRAGTPPSPAAWRRLGSRPCSPSRARNRRRLC
jgi:hypothetical protein